MDENTGMKTQGWNHVQLESDCMKVIKGVQSQTMISYFDLILDDTKASISFVVFFRGFYRYN